MGVQIGVSGNPPIWKVTASKQNIAGADTALVYFQPRATPSQRGAAHL